MAKKKKKGKKSKEELEAEKEQKRVEREQILEEQKQFVEYENRRNEEKIKLDGRHHEIRMIQLQNTVNKFAALGDLMLDEELEARHLREWNLYIKEDRLPNPPIVPEMNTYLHRWHIDDSTYLIKNIPKKTDEVLSLLHILEEFMDLPLLANERLIKNWKEVHDDFCYELRHHFDVATYRILRFVEENMNRKGLNEYSFAMEAENFRIYLWTILPLPTPMVQPPATSKDCNFPKIGVSVTIPEYLSKLDLVVRGLYVNYDHFSSLCNTNTAAPLPEEMKQDLATRSEEEREHTVRIQNEEVNVRLKKLNQLRLALIGLATEYNNEIPEYEAAKAAGKDKKKKKAANEKDDEKLKAFKRREENIQNLMSELNLDNLSALSTPGSRASSKDDESSSKKSRASKKKGRKGKGKGKKGGPEKDFWATMEKIKNIPLQKSASTVFAEREEIDDAHLREILCISHELAELNLRKYVIVGGVVQTDLLLLLPQPYQHPEKYLLSLVHLPVGLEVIPDEKLHPPPPEEKDEKPVIVARKSTLQQLSAMLKSLVEIKDSVLEKESKKQDSKEEKEEKGEKGGKGEKEEKPSKKEKKSKLSTTRKVTYDHKDEVPTVSTAEMTEEDRKMFRLTSMIEFVVDEGLETPQYPKMKLKLRDDVIYFEPPIIVQWDEEKQYWSRSHCVHVEVHGKEVTFRVKKFGPMAFATLRHSNVPFQSWDLRPCHDDDSVELRIRAKHINVVFKIKEDEVCLVSVEKMPQEILSDIIGKYKKHLDVIKYMQSKGVDIFPEDDAFCYVSDAEPKHTIVEEHLYHCMAILSGVYNFYWSRWNMQQDRRRIVLLMREFLDRWHPINPNTLLVTPLRVGVLDLKEWAPEFKEEYIPGMKFYADLNSCMQDQMSLHIQKKVRASTTMQIETVYDMLRRTKVISFTTSYPEKEKEPFVSYQVPPPAEDKKKKGKGKGKGKKGKKGKKSKNEEGKDEKGKEEEKDKKGKDEGKDKKGKDEGKDKKGKDEEKDKMGKDEEKDKAGKDEEKDKAGKDEEKDKLGMDEEKDKMGKEEEEEKDKMGKDEENEETEYDEEEEEEGE